MKTAIAYALRKYRRAAPLLKKVSRAAFSFMIIAGMVMMSLGISGIVANRASAKGPTAMPMVATGWNHTLGLLDNGTVVATGVNTYGQCNVTSWTDIIHVAGGGYHSVGVKSDGTVVAVGNNDEGQCNVDSWTGIVQVAAGSNFTIGLKSDGTVVATGDDTYGQCNVSGWTGITQVAAHSSHTLGLKSDDTVVATGDDTYGQCSDVGDWSGITQVAAGGSHSLGLKPDGTVVAVGSGSEGAVSGVGDWVNITQVAAGLDFSAGLTSTGTVVTLGANDGGQGNTGSWTNITQIDARGYHTVGLVNDGTAVATGYNDNGQCNVSPWTGISQIAAGGNHTVGLKSDGSVIAGGDNSSSQCHVYTWTGIDQVAAGQWHTVGLKSDDTVVATGNNNEGQCNVGSWSGITHVAAGSLHTVGLESDGTVVATGYNGDGQCNVGSWSGITQVAAGSSHTLGLVSGGTVVAVGDNSEGQCDVGGWTGIIQVAAGSNFTIGLKSDGTVVATGYNGDGQCNVGSWSGITQIAAGGHHTVGLKSDGSVVATGYDSNGSVNEVSSWTGIDQVAAGTNHTVGVKDDGTTVAEGSNNRNCDVGWNLIIPVVPPGLQQTWYASYTGITDWQYRADMVPADTTITIPDGEERIFVYEADEAIIFADSTNWDIQVTLASAMVPSATIHYTIGLYDPDTGMIPKHSGSITTTGSETVYTPSSVMTTGFTLDKGTPLLFMLSPEDDDMELKTGSNHTWFHADGRDYAWYCSGTPMSGMYTYALSTSDSHDSDTLLIGPYTSIIWTSSTAAGEGGNSYSGNWSLKLTLDEALPAGEEIRIIFGWTDPDLNIFDSSLWDSPPVTFYTEEGKKVYDSNEVNPGAFTVPEGHCLAVLLQNFSIATMTVITGGSDNSWLQHSGEGSTKLYGTSDEVPAMLYGTYTYDPSALTIPDGVQYLFAYYVMQAMDFSAGDWTFRITLDTAIGAGNTIDFALVWLHFGEGSGFTTVADGSVLTEEDETEYETTGNAGTFTALAGHLLIFAVEPDGAAIDLLVDAGMSTCFESPDGNIWACSSQPLHEGIKYEMFKGDTSQGEDTITIAPWSEPVIWIADEEALIPCTFPNGNWDVQLTLSVLPASGTGCNIEIGYVDDGLSFQAMHGPHYIPLSDSETEYNVSVPTLGGFTVAKGYSLAMRLSNVSAGDDMDMVVNVGGANTWFQSPEGDPGYPVPEAAAYILIGAGLLCIGGYLGYRRFRNRAVVNS